MHCLICHYTSVILSTTIVHCVSAHCKLAIICKDNDDVQNCTCYDTFLVRRNLPTLIMRELTTNVYSGLSHNLKPFRTFLLLLGARQNKINQRRHHLFLTGILGYKYLLRPRSSQSTINIYIWNVIFQFYHQPPSFGWSWVANMLFKILFNNLC